MWPVIGFLRSPTLWPIIKGEQVRGLILIRFKLGILKMAYPQDNKYRSSIGTVEFLCFHIHCPAYKLNYCVISTRQCKWTEKKTTENKFYVQVCFWFLFLTDWGWAPLKKLQDKRTCKFILESLPCILI